MTSATRALALVMVTAWLSAPVATAAFVPDFNGVWLVVQLPAFMQGLAKSGQALKDVEVQVTIKQSETIISSTQRAIDKKTGKSVPPEFPTTYWYPDGRDIRSVQPDRTVRSTRTTWEGETLVIRTVTIKNGQAIQTYTSRWSLNKSGMLENSSTIEQLKSRPASDLMILKRK